jgi:NAD(P)-dependent dehydrogenase (short-subunit alcohol dehydrogenase family)
MVKEFEGQVAVVTGAASGLGLAIAKKLYDEGAQLALLDLNESALQNAAIGIGPNVKAISLDLTNEQTVANAINQIGESLGRIDILVNSAGITGATNIKSHNVDTANLQLVFEVNFMASYYTSRYTLPWMLKHSYGRILHIASIAGKEGNAGMLAYSASKAAVIGMAKVQGKEYAESGITVNALAPAVIQTPMVDAMPDEQVKYMTDKIPMKRCGTLDEIAHMAAFIVSPGTAFTTGFTFDMTGGRATY